MYILIYSIYWYICYFVQKNFDGLHIFTYLSILSCYACILFNRAFIISYRSWILSVLSFNFNRLSVWDIFIFSLNKSSILIERAIFRVIFILVLKCSLLSATRCIKENSVNKSYAWCVYPLISISFVCYTIRFNKP